MAFKGYGQFCPVAKAAEVLTERWTPLIVRELLCGSRRFNELRRGVPLMSPALLSQRLKQLQDAGVVERRRAAAGAHWEYHLTPAGEELRDVIERLGVWGQRWARTPDGEPDLDPGLLMWDMRRRIHTDRLPAGRVVVQIDFGDAPERQAHWWLVLAGEVDVCLIHPGFEVDLRIATDVETMTRIWLGDVSFAAAVRSGAVWLGGPAHLRRAFPEWLGLSAFAGVNRPDTRQARSSSRPE
jgi:DNA-binding HxlR family transcriptional regulator